MNGESVSQLGLINVRMDNRNQRCIGVKANVLRTGHRFVKWKNLLSKK
jgi:hypothetical protein